MVQEIDTNPSRTVIENVPVLGGPALENSKRVAVSQGYVSDEKVRLGARGTQRFSVYTLAVDAAGPRKFRKALPGPRLLPTWGFSAANESNAGQMGVASEKPAAR